MTRLPETWIVFIYRKSENQWFAAPEHPHNSRAGAERARAWWATQAYVSDTRICPVDTSKAEGGK